MPEAEEELVRSAADEVALLALFDGIGGQRRAFDLLGIAPSLFISVECLPAAVRVVRRAWPDAVQLEKVQDITAGHFESWRVKRPRLRKLLISAGFPCQGMSGLNAQAKGLKDARSALFWEIPRIRKLAEQAWPDAAIALLVENTESKYLQDVSDALGIWPIRAEAAEICDARRPRFFWCSFRLLQCEDLVALEATSRGWHMRLKEQGHGPARWLDRGSSFSGSRLPTFVQVIPRAQPHFLPAGLRTCKKHELARWKAASYSTPPYQFRDECTIQRADGSRGLASAREREILMGFAIGHTAAAVPSSEIKLLRSEQLRQSLLGNSFQCEIVAFLTGHLMVHWGFLRKPASFAEIRARASPADGPPAAMPNFRGGISPEVALVLEHQRGLDPRGSDVRLDTGTLMAPKIYPRKAIAAAFWNWKPVFRNLWRHADHINVLEAIVILQALKWRARSRSRLGTRFCTSATALYPSPC
jgi:hypothetical protein